MIVNVMATFIIYFVCSQWWYCDVLLYWRPPQYTLFLFLYYCIASLSRSIFLDLTLYFGSRIMYDTYLWMYIIICSLSNSTSRNVYCVTNISKRLWDFDCLHQYVLHAIAMSLSKNISLAWWEAIRWLLTFICYMLDNFS